MGNSDIIRSQLGFLSDESLCFVFRGLKSSENCQISSKPRDFFAKNDLHGPVFESFCQFKTK